LLVTSETYSVKVARGGDIPAVAEKPDFAAQAKRLDESAKWLLGAVTLTTGLLAAVGLNADRLPMLVASGDAESYLTGALGCAVAAVLAGVVAISFPGTSRGWVVGEAVVVAIGILVFVVGVALLGRGASTGLKGNGRPTVTEISATTTDSKQTQVTFAVRADGVKIDDRLTVFAVSVRKSPSEPVRAPLFTSTLRPNDRGVVDQKITFTMNASSAPSDLSVQVYRHQDEPAESAIPTSCAEVDQAKAPACARIAIPALPAGP
jgi:hypothetical protein